MKRIITLSIAALVFAGSAMAQDNKKDSSARWKFDGKHHHQAAGKEKAAKFAKELNLSDAQKQQIKQINQEYKGKDKSMRDERKSKIEAVLTADQKAKLQQLREQRSGKNKEQHGQRGADMKKELGLSDAQSQQLKALNEDFRKQAEAIRNNSSLSQDQKKEQLKTLGEQRKEKMKTILTPDQQKKLEGMKHKREKK